MKSHNVNNIKDPKISETYAIMVARILLLAIEDLDTIGMGNSGILLNQVVHDIMNNYNFDTTSIRFRAKLDIC